MVVCLLSIYKDFAMFWFYKMSKIKSPHSQGLEKTWEEMLTQGTEKKGQTQDKGRDKQSMSSPQGLRETQCARREQCLI